MLTVKIRRNGEQGIFLPIEGMENVQVVTVQTDGEVRWASIGSLSPDKAIHFSRAIELAIYLAKTPDVVRSTTATNFLNQHGQAKIKWMTIDERTK